MLTVWSSPKFSNLVKSYLLTSAITTQCHIMMHYRYIAVENVRTGEIACNKQISPLLTMFSTLYGTYFSF